MSEILVVGSLGYDSITTPDGARDNILGGSANYFSYAASFYAPVRLVGVVGEDYKASDFQLLRQRKVDLDGLTQKKGKTFHWEGRYQEDMSEAITLTTELNVFEDFDPKIPVHYQQSSFVFLANIDPELQLQVLDQIKKPKFVGADTMNFWITSKLSKLKEVLKRVDVLLINEGEAKLLTQKSNAIAAAQQLTEMGPKAVVIKRGEYGFVLFSEGKFFILPAFPIGRVVDPTGAGDTFAAGFFGYLAKTNADVGWRELRTACVHGCLMASFTVEDFGLGCLEKLDWARVEARHNEYKKIVACDET
jgi:sugar/nucleoside kinase (ribokinase family)